MTPAEQSCEMELSIWGPLAAAEYMALSFWEFVVHAQTMLKFDITS